MMGTVCPNDVSKEIVGRRRAQEFRSRSRMTLDQYIVVQCQGGGVAEKPAGKSQKSDVVQ
ncbi:MAG: hypothetical protein OJF47_002040 [Nitrospira sp.]|nr:MAG: hypothetical protein OJF47_002040 [Nitrospira sp.]